MQKSAPAYEMRATTVASESSDTFPNCEIDCQRAHVGSPRPIDISGASCSPKSDEFPSAVTPRPRPEVYVSSLPDITASLADLAADEAASSAFDLSSSSFVSFAARTFNAARSCPHQATNPRGKRVSIDTGPMSMNSSAMSSSEPNEVRRRILAGGIFISVPGIVMLTQFGCNNPLVVVSAMAVRHTRWIVGATSVVLIGA